MNKTLAFLALAFTSACAGPQQVVSPAALTPATYFCGYTFRTIAASRLFDAKTHQRTPVTLRTGPDYFWDDAMGANHLTSSVQLTPGGLVRPGEGFYVNFGTKNDHTIKVDQTAHKLSKGFIHFRFYGCSY
jgi:hypothetical protein